jgi:hypothetical protein
LLRLMSSPVISWRLRTITPPKPIPIRAFIPSRRMLPALINCHASEATAIVALYNLSSLWPVHISDHSTFTFSSPGKSGPFSLL